LGRRTKMKNSTKGTLIALSVAALFAARDARATDGGTTDSSKADAKVRCAGINECSGKGSCHGNGNSCAGTNSCKGKGVVETSRADCEKQGGKIIAD
ncbi:MAG: hypothetical protein WCH13_12690, partial [Deltaproteobacteria bacterium]